MELVRENRRFEFTRLAPETRDADGSDVVAGLTDDPKWLPCRYFYDARGSELFERICETPEYYPTRTERGILEAHAGEIAALTGPCELVELGSGAALKTRILLEAYAETGEAVHFAPIDVSESILKESSLALVEDFEALTIRGFSGTYEQALGALHPAPAPARMFIFLGSTIGNFNDDERAGFFERLGAAMNEGDYFLLGFDRRKDPAVIEAAYNDAQGLTAAFNLNILSHLNARFDGDFETDKFRHVAFYDSALGRIEMHLESLARQRVALRGLGFTTDLDAGERIHTEISQKFDAEPLAAELAGHGFERMALWSDAKAWFSLMALRLGGTGAG